MSIDSLATNTAEDLPLDSLRPTITATRHVVSAGHYLAAHAGFAILDVGGNAVDAGVAAGLVLGVVQSDLVNIAGVAPIMVFDASKNRVHTISGLGTWPKAVSADLFRTRFGGQIPHGVVRTVVPAAPDAWITALERFGTMSFGEVATSAVRFADEGFVMYPLMAALIGAFESEYRRWPSSAAVYLPGGRLPAVGDVFVQKDLAATLRYMVDQERAAAKHGREAGLAAARAAFYSGDIARTIVRFHEQNDGFLTMEDLQDFSVAIESPTSIRFGELNVTTCGPWCQGPVLLQMLGILRNTDLASMGHNTPEYLHHLVEAIKLAFADRHYHYGDPRMIDVPLDRLLSDAYCAGQADRIRSHRAAPEMPSPGLPTNGRQRSLGTGARSGADIPPSLDTSYVCVVDAKGNGFSATPSDVSYDTPIIPGTGLCPSSRGAQSWTQQGHPSEIAPGKRPRLTPSPAMAFIGRERVIPFGTPGGDVQTQAMIQVLLNLHVFGMTPQAAVEAPRCASYSFPDSFEPHTYYPGRLKVEARIEPEVVKALRALGHDVQPWPEWTWRAGAVCLIDSDRVRKVHGAAADPRRPGYALGW